MFRLNPIQTSKQNGHQPYALMRKKGQNAICWEGFFFFPPFFFPLSHNWPLNKIYLQKNVTWGSRSEEKKTLEGVDTHWQKLLEASFESTALGQLCVGGGFVFPEKQGLQVMES